MGLPVKEKISHVLCILILVGTCATANPQAFEQQLKAKRGKLVRRPPSTTTFDVAVRVRDLDTSSIWGMSSLGGFSVLEVALTDQAASDAEMSSRLAEELEEISEPVLTSVGGVITHLNRAAQQDLGWRRGDLVGEKLTRRLIRREDLNSAPEAVGQLQVQRVHALRKNRSRGPYLMATEEDQGVLAGSQRGLQRAQSAVRMCTVQGGGPALTLKVQLRRDPSRLLQDDEEARIVDGLAHELAVPIERIDLRVAPSQLPSHDHVEEFEDSRGQGAAQHALSEEEEEEEEAEVPETADEPEENDDHEVFAVDEEDLLDDSSTQASRLSYRMNTMRALPKARMLRSQV